MEPCREDHYHTERQDTMTAAWPRPQTNFSIQKAKPPKIISSLIKTSFAGWVCRNDLPSRHDADKDDVYLILLLGNILYVV